MTWNVVGEHSVDPSLLDCYQRWQWTADGWEVGGCKKAYPRCRNEIEITEELWKAIGISEEEDVSLVVPPGMPHANPNLNCLVPVHDVRGGRWGRGTCQCGIRGIKYEEVVPPGTLLWGPRIGPGGAGAGIPVWDARTSGLRVGSWEAEYLKQTFTVWWTTGTTRSDLKHPKTGKKRPLYRRLDLKNFSDPKAELGQLFANPRKHTGVGYYTKVRQLCGDVQR